MSWLEKLDKVPRRYLNIILLALTTFPLLVPLGIPVPISEPVRTGYDFIESLPEGSYAIVTQQVGAVGIPSQGPGMRALLQHLLRRELKVVIVSFLPDGPGVWETFLKPYLIIGDNVYGEDYVFLGYVAGIEMGMRAFATDIRSVVTSDFYDTPIDELPIMKDFNSATGASVIVSAGSFYSEEVIMQIQSVAGVPIIIQCSAGGATAGMGFYPDTAIGIMTGIKGGAEYESLIGRKGLATATLDGNQAGMIGILVFIVLGNIIYLSKRGKGR